MFLLVLLIRDVYPGSRILVLYPSRIPDPKTATKERGEKKIFCHTFFYSHKFLKIEIYLTFELLKNNIWANFQRIIELFIQKNCHQVLKNMGLGSGIWQKPIPDPGSQTRGQKSTGSVRNTVFFCDNRNDFVAQCSWNVGRVMLKKTFSSPDYENPDLPWRTAWVWRRDPERWWS